MTPLIILGVAGTLFTLAAALGSAIAVLRSSALRQTIDVQAGTIAALEKARAVDREATIQHKAECSERISALEGRAAGLESLVAQNIADVVARAVVTAIEDRRPGPPRTRTRTSPRKAG